MYPYYTNIAVNPEEPKLPKHSNMLDKFNELKQDEQNNLLKLAWFVL